MTGRNSNLSGSVSRKNSAIVSNLKLNKAKSQRQEGSRTRKAARRNSDFQTFTNLHRLQLDQMGKEAEDASEGEQ